MSGRGRKLLALGLGTVAALLLAEVSVRIFEASRPALVTKRWLIREKPSRVLYHCYPTNPHGEFRSLPDISSGTWRLETALLDPLPVPLSRLSETPYCVEYRESSQGLREDRILGPQPPSGVVRILGVGDSFAVGEGVPRELSLFPQLETLLGRDHEVINAARPGADTHEEAATLRRLAAAFGCTRGLLIFVPNDVKLTPELGSAQSYINDLINVRVENLETTSPGWSAGPSRLIGLLASVLQARRIEGETLQWYRDSYDPALNGGNLRRLAEDFARVASIPGCRVAVVLYPLLLPPEKGVYPLRAVHERVAEMATRAGLPVLDLADTFPFQDADSLWVHPIDRHPNGRAHGIAAKAVARWLRDEVPGFLDEDSGKDSGG